MTADHINQRLRLQASVVEPVKHRAGIPEAPAAFGEPGEYAGGAKEKIGGLEIKPSLEDFDFVRDLVYSEVPEGEFFMNAESLLKLISEKAQNLKIQPAALVLRLMEALDRLLAGQKRIIAGAITDLSLAKQFQRKQKLTPQESLAVLVRGLRAALQEISKSDTELPSNEALDFAQNLETQKSGGGTFLSSVQMRGFCARQYDIFMSNTDPSKPKELLQSKFINFWNSFGKRMAEEAAANRQLEAPNAGTKLIS
jgi:hypothetical protein